VNKKEYTIIFGVVGIHTVVF